MNIPTVIFITALNAAGKGMVVERLCSNYGFSAHSVRKFLNEHTERQTVIVDRPGLGTLADKFRDKYGPEYIIKSLFEESTAMRTNIVIESVRCPGEVDYIMNLKEIHKGVIDIVLVSVEADIDVRYERAKARGSITDNVTFDEFKAQELAESIGTEPGRMNIPKCMERADARILNNTNNVDDLDAEIRLKLLRPIF